MSRWPLVLGALCAMASWACGGEPSAPPPPEEPPPVPGDEIVAMTKPWNHTPYGMLLEITTIDGAIQAATAECNCDVYSRAVSDKEWKVILIGHIRDGAILRLRVSDTANSSYRAKILQASQPDGVYATHLGDYSFTVSPASE